ncbi:copper resistance protein NlpE [Shewanella algae]|uniref:copper resistance protein NlpE n=1 Tax=Shewanella algae TaxID=38313 RepID=UPI001BEDF148|nr:copper resistance protein NlpE [Shewanella algae]BCV60629.1 copper resistance protein [Shewanella algae]
MNKSTIFALLMTSGMALGLAACQDQETQSPAANSQTATATAPAEQTAQVPMGDTSQNALDWEGSYKGLLPCADCSGIETTLTLKGDNSYRLQQVYQGKDESIFSESGKFTWDASGGKITLEDGSKYLVGENQLFMLDREGNRITGSLADNYRLSKEN